MGPENISRDPAIRDTYNQVWGNKLVFDTKFSNRPAAVVLPGNTKEVQAVVRICNRYKISFKPFSSGFEVVSTSLVSENSIILDLKRMNRIVEIDVENMHAVVEPYVSVFRLQMELAKHGLFLGPISAGPEAGVIASSCCHFGSGNTQVFTGGLGRNVLGCEWVLPTGELIRMGSAEAGNGWFSADGPGFGLRGILRGHSGANGGNGVITKVSHKLYPWYGPPQWELKGSPPGMKQLEEVLDGYKFFIITFPSVEIMHDAVREVGQAEITYSIMQFLEGIKSESNDEFFAIIQEIMGKRPAGRAQLRRYLTHDRDRWKDGEGNGLPGKLPLEDMRRPGRHQGSRAERPGVSGLAFRPRYVGIQLREGVFPALFRILHHPLHGCHRGHDNASTKSRGRVHHAPHSGRGTDVHAVASRIPSALRELFHRVPSGEHHHVRPLPMRNPLRESGSSSRKRLIPKESSGPLVFPVSVAGSRLSPKAMWFRTGGPYMTITTCGSEKSRKPWIPTAWGTGPPMCRRYFREKGF